MESSTSRSPHPLLITGLCIAAAVGAGCYLDFTARQARLESSPSAVRPGLRSVFSSGSGPYDTPAAFPMNLTHASPRQVAERYLALDSGRRIEVDPVAMTIEFEPPRKSSWITRTVDWFKKQPWMP